MKSFILFGGGFAAFAYERIFIEMRNMEIRFVRTATYTDSRRACPIFSPQISQSGAVKRLMSLTTIRHHTDFTSLVNLLRKFCALCVNSHDSVHMYINTPINLQLDCSGNYIIYLVSIS